MSLSKKISTREKTFIAVGLVFIVILTIILIFSYRIGKITPQAATTQTFSDVPTNYWAYNQIEAIYAAGITGGCATNPLKYCPEDSVTREQMAAFLAKSYYYPNQPPNPLRSGSSYFTDVPAGSTFDKYIGNIKELGITQGCTTTTTYCPQDKVTREQMAAFLTRTFKLDTSDFIPNDFQTHEMDFKDVPTNSSFWKEIQGIYAYRITQGCTSNSFCPSNSVTRAQMAVFLSNAALNNRGEGNVNINLQISPVAANSVVEVDTINPDTGEQNIYFRAWTNSQGKVDLKGLKNYQKYQFTVVPANTTVGHCDWGYSTTPTLATGNYQYTISVYPQVTYYQGTITDIDTGLPIEGAGVVVQDSQGQPLSSDLTDYDGKYSYIGTFEAAPKTHQMKVYASGYESQTVNLTSAVCSTKAQNISLKRLNY